MPDVKVTPNNVWPQATSSTVEDGDQTYENIPVLYESNTPATLTIRKEEYPNGVTVLNEETPPINQDPITLPADITSGTSQQIDIVFDSGWPSGRVVLFV
jgi:hypothetical protein